MSYHPVGFNKNGRRTVSVVDQRVHATKQEDKDDLQTDT